MIAMFHNYRVIQHAAAKHRTLTASLLGRALLAWLLVLALVACAAALGVRLNLSPSVPRGFYRTSRTAPTPGGYALVCAPPWPVFREARAHGYIAGGACPGNFRPLIKVVAAMHGETVAVSPLGVTINGRQWPRSAPLRFDASGWELPSFRTLERALEQHEVLVMSEQCALGFDARYFGPIPRSSLMATVVPLLTW